MVQYLLLKIPIPSNENPMRDIMTNNHVLNKNCLKSGESFKLYKYKSNDIEPIKIQINDKNFVFTSELIDVTFIELNNEIIEEINPYFLKPSNRDINESIHIFQFPKSKFSTSTGKIKEIHGFNYFMKYQQMLDHMDRLF
jgi:hypothetical protein